MRRTFLQLHKSTPTPRTDGALFLRTLQIEAGGLWRLVTGHRHHALLGQFSIAKLGYAAVPTGGECQIIGKLGRTCSRANADAGGAQQERSRHRHLGAAKPLRLIGTPSRSRPSRYAVSSGNSAPF